MTIHVKTIAEARRVIASLEAQVADLEKRNRRVRGGSECVVNAARALALGAALLAGCAGPLPIAVHIEDERAAPEPIEHDAWGPLLPEVVVDACEVLALECYRTESDSRWGVVRLRLVDDAGDGVSGHTEGRGWCRKAARVEARTDTIAHELGHVFLLEHDDDESNLMFASRSRRDPDASLDLDQIEAVHESAARFSRGCL